MSDPRAFPTCPIVGVGAVIFDGDRVLLVKRAHAPLKGEWSLPGGRRFIATASRMEPCRFRK